MTDSSPPDPVDVLVKTNDALRQANNALANAVRAPDPVKPPSTFKENAGAIASLLLVASVVSIGFAQMLAEFFGHKVSVSDVWVTSLQSMASIGLGYLVGRPLAKGGYSQEQFDAALAAPPPATSRRGPCPPLSPPPLSPPPPTAAPGGLEEEFASPVRRRPPPP